MLKVRQFHDSFIFNMGIPIAESLSSYWDGAQIARFE